MFFGHLKIDKTANQELLFIVFFAFEESWFANYTLE
jgi:hypothetical protein